MYVWMGGVGVGLETENAHINKHYPRNDSLA